MVYLIAGGRDDYGLRMEISVDPTLENTASKVQLGQDGVISFPYDYYRPSFKTFSGASYNSYNKPLRHIFVDASKSNDSLATERFIRDSYESRVEATKRSGLSAAYRATKDSFTSMHLGDLNQAMKGESYRFALKTTPKDNLESSLTILDNGIRLDNKGRGEQVRIKTEMAVGGAGTTPTVLIEEPENHLSHTNTRKLIERISQITGGAQLFITTHSSLVVVGLGLKRCVMMDNDTQTTLSLGDLSDDTERFFLKAPNNNILEYILSKRVILVEGASEYILVQQFIQNYRASNPRAPDSPGVHVISANGLTSKRYLDIAIVLRGIKVAVILDNDGNHEKNCKDRYAKYEDYDNILPFYEDDDQKTTLEDWIYASNSAQCDELFGGGDPIERMKKGKTEAAYKLIKECGDKLASPTYIEKAIAWVMGKETNG